MVFGKQRVAQCVQGFRPLHVVGHAWRGGEIGDASFAVGVGQGGGGVAADVGDELAEAYIVITVNGEVAILPSIQVQRPVGALGCKHRNHSVALVQCAKLLCPADFRLIRAARQQRDRHLPGVDFLFDLRAPHSSAREALRIEPRIEAFGGQVGLQALRQFGSIFAGVRNEDAHWLRRWHGATGHYQSRSWCRQQTVYDFDVRPVRERSA